MRLSKLVVTVILGVSISSTIVAESVTRESGGQIKIRNPNGVAVLNKESSLTREWITIHDSSLPADLLGTAGINFLYTGEYWTTSEYSIIGNEDISAIEVRFLTFNIWGDHSGNLSATHIVDIESGKGRAFESVWRVYSENEAAEHYASIAYIAQVRTKSGKVIRADIQTVLEQARKFSKKFSEDDLESEPEKE